MMCLIYNVIVYNTRILFIVYNIFISIFALMPPCLLGRTDSPQLLLKRRIKMVKPQTMLSALEVASLISQKKSKE